VVKYNVRRKEGNKIVFTELNVLNSFTLIVILAIYGSMFIAQYKKKEDGIIVNFEGLGNCRNGGLGVIVRLKDGKEVQASISGCTACLDNLGEGSSVKVLNLGDKYVVAHTPLDSLKLSRGGQCKISSDNSDDYNNKNVGSCNVNKTI